MFSRIPEAGSHDSSMFLLLRWVGASRTDAEIKMSNLHSMWGIVIPCHPNPYKGSEQDNLLNTNESKSIFVKPLAWLWSSSSLSLRSAAATPYISLHTCLSRVCGRTNWSQTLLSFVASEKCWIVYWWILKQYQRIPKSLTHSDRWLYHSFPSPGPAITSVPSKPSRKLALPSVIITCFGLRISMALTDDSAEKRHGRNT